MKFSCIVVLALLFSGPLAGCGNGVTERAPADKEAPTEVFPEGEDTLDPNE